MGDLSRTEIDPGLVVLFGSGETSPSGRKIFETVFKQLPQNPRLALLETPAGFELNSTQVIGRVADFLEHRLQNYQPQIKIIPARRKGTEFSPENETIVAPLLDSDLIFMGPGSPSYAVRQLQDSLAWDYVLARHRLGAALVLASSAVVAIGAYSLPVYEIYKVGEDLHWKAGLDFFGQYGLPLVFIPHWNNNDGGEELDTSRCFMGKPRFQQLMKMLHAEATVIGIDEKTALIMDLKRGECSVTGSGSVTLIHTGHKHTSPGPDLQGTGLEEIIEQRSGHIHIFSQGEVFSLQECCPIDARGVIEGRPLASWKRALEVHRRLNEQRGKQEQQEIVTLDSSFVPEEVKTLAERRQSARDQKDWAKADALRDRLVELGWKVVDTPDGPRLIPIQDPDS